MTTTRTEDTNINIVGLSYLGGLLKLIGLTIIVAHLFMGIM